MTDDLKAPERIWAFDRYVNGVLMAEGVTVTRASSFEEACVKATKLASRGPNNEAPVLVLAHRDAEHIATLEAALADAQKERDTAREWLGAANNEFGSAAWDWPDLWRRIAQLKDLSNERWQRAEKAEVALAETEALEEQHGAMIQRLCGELADMTQQRDAAMAGAVKVRELVWEDVDAICTRQKAPALGGYYSVVEFDANTEEAHFATNIDLGGLAFVFVLEPDPLGGRRPKQYSTLEAAKAAAQADYEVRIISALTPDPDRMLALTAAAYEDASLETLTLVMASVTDIAATLLSRGDEAGANGLCILIRTLEQHNATIPKSVAEALTTANALAALSRIEAQAEARGMRICADIYYTRCCADDDGDDVYREMTASADATEAAAKGGV